MSSLNQLISEIAHSVGDPNNYALRQNIRGLIIHTRNELIRHSMEQHGYVDSGLQQRYKISLKEVNDGEEVYDENYTEWSKCTILRSTQKVPRPTRFTNNLPFMRVSTVGYKFNQSIPYIKESTARFRAALPGMKGQRCYDYINDYLYIFIEESVIRNLSKEADKYIVIESVFENPTEVAEDNGSYSFDEDDNEWFIPEDMVGQIKDIIIKRDLLTNHRENNEIPNNVKMK